MSDSGNGDDAAGGPRTTATGSREVVVPMRLYKVVTVFSTLIAVLAFVVGFSVLDLATKVLGNPEGSLVVRMVAGVLGRSPASLSSWATGIALVTAVLGLGVIVAGAGVYVYATRFRTAGMGKPKDESDESSDND